MRLPSKAKTAIVTIVEESIVDGVNYTETTVYSVEFEGDLHEVTSPAGDHIVSLSKVVWLKQLKAW